METVTLAALHSSFSHSKNASSLLVSAPSINHPLKLGFPGGAIGKGPACQCRRCKRRCFDLRVGKIPQRRAWQSTPVFLPGESYGQRSLAGYSLQGHKRVRHDLATKPSIQGSKYSLSSKSCLNFSQFSREVSIILFFLIRG